MPGRLIVHAIEAADLTQGTGLTPPVAAAVGIVAGRHPRRHRCKPSLTGAVVSADFTTAS